MEVRDLRYFLVLADELHFGRAAERLHIAQPALSQRLKRLERELELLLLERDSRHVRLTDAGEQLRVKAEEAVAHFDAVAAAMARVREAGAGRLIVGISPGIRVELLRMLLTSAEAGADVTTRSVAGYEADALLIRHHIDAALVHARPQGTGLRFVVVEDIALGVAMPSGHRLARRRTIPPAELTGEALYWLGRNSEPALYDEVMAKLGAAGYAGGGTQQSGSVDTALDLVAAGLGVSLKFRHEVVKAGRRGIVWRPLTIDVTVPTVLAWRTGDGSPLLQAFRRAAERAARGDA